MAFDSLTEKLQNVFKNLRSKGRLTEDDVKEALKEIKRALLAADVNFKVVKDFIKSVQERAIGQDVMNGLNPGQMVIKIVNEELINLMGSETTEIKLQPGKAITVIMMAGLQGAGKTTTTAKLAGKFKLKGKKPLLVACDVYRPAAIKQLQVNGEKQGVEVFSMGENHKPANIAKAAIELIWVCLIKFMVKIVMTLIPDGKAVDMDPAKPVFLDDKIISQPAAALQLVAKEILRVSEMVKVIVADTITIVKTEDINELEPLQEKGLQIKKLTDQITEYLASLFSAGTMTEQQAAQTASLMYILSDVERMGTLSVEVAKCVQEKIENRYKYTPEAMEELQKSLKTLEKMFTDSIKALQGDKSVQTEKLIKRKDKIMDLDLKMRKAHVQRVNKGKCKASLTAPFTNILHLIDRMGNSCVNLADVASNEISLNYFMVN